MANILIRTLGADEFVKLETVSDGIVPDPEITIALVAEKDSGIVARMFLMAPAHIEGTWIHEDARHGTLGKRLMDRMEIEAKKSGISKLFAYIAEPAIEDYVDRLGFVKQPVTVWMKEI